MLSKKKLNQISNAKYGKYNNYIFQIIKYIDNKHSKNRIVIKTYTTMQRTKRITTEKKNYLCFENKSDFNIGSIYFTNCLLLYKYNNIFNNQLYTARTCQNDGL